MPLPEPRPGLVISYAYLWREEAARGREDGIKDRPCVVVLAVRRDQGGTMVTVAPITRSQPRSEETAVELPLAVKQRLGLDNSRSWVVVTEVNRFRWPGPDLRPISADRPGQFAYGGLPEKLMRRIIERISTLHRDRRFRMVPREI